MIEVRMASSAILLTPLGLIRRYHNKLLDMCIFVFFVVVTTNMHEQKQKKKCKRV